LVALACAPTYEFVSNGHCKNGALDPNAGESDVDCGGSECKGCGYGQHCTATSDCANGACIVGFCQEPGCNNQAQDSNETGVDCGGPCFPCRAGQNCRIDDDCQSDLCGDDGLCTTATCHDEVRNDQELGVDCGGPVCDGCGIGSPCLVDPDCESGSCDDATKLCAVNCSHNTDECDGNTDEPCETNLYTDSKNCGACGMACDLPHADSSCTGGKCQIDTCVAPWIRCNTDDTDGCEVNSSADAGNCGACGTVCPALHGTPMCVKSACVIDCAPGFGDCDHDPLTGCETSVSDVDNCGACGKKCPSTGGEPYCVDGQCGMTACSAGKGDCDGDQQCEAELDTDPYNCGRCGNVCSAANGKSDCVGGKCVVTSCDDGWQNCNGSEKDGGYANGCETNVASDSKNCGACLADCETLGHSAGTCQDGRCALLCDTGFEDCDGKLDNGCEADTTSDPAHCGGCDNPCQFTHASAACVNSGCVIDACDANYKDCTAAAGCETDVSSSVQHCGSCTGTCSNAGATAVSCSNGKCNPPTCDAAHKSCDDKNENGCEADVTTSAQCGACGAACAAATPNCVLSGNSYACQARITVANAQPYPAAQVSGSTLTFNATPHAGTNRLILLAIAAESPGNGLAGARPDSVKFGGTLMAAGPAQVGNSDFSSPDLFTYYLALGDSTVEGTQVQVTIDGSTAPAENAIIVQQLQLNGVRQTNSITGSAGGFLGTTQAEAPDPSVITLSLPLTVSGSAVYSLIATMWSDGGGCTPNTPATNCPSWSIAPSANLTVTETLASPQLSAGSAVMRAFGMFVNAASPGLPDAGTYAPSWSVPWSGRMTHLAVAIAPASQ
jgi:hypothetical protein